MGAAKPIADLRRSTLGAARALRVDCDDVARIVPRCRLTANRSDRESWPSKLWSADDVPAAVGSPSSVPARAEGCGAGLRRRCALRRRRRSALVTGRRTPSGGTMSGVGTSSIASTASAASSGSCGGRGPRMRTREAWAGLPRESRGRGAARAATSTGSVPPPTWFDRAEPPSAANVASGSRVGTFRCEASPSDTIGSNGGAFPTTRAPLASLGAWASPPNTTSTSARTSVECAVVPNALSLATAARPRLTRPRLREKAPVAGDRTGGVGGSGCSPMALGGEICGLLGGSPPTFVEVTPLTRRRCDNGRRRCFRCGTSGGTREETESRS